MNIYVYSDESGVFDKAHNDFFVYGGLILLEKEERDICARKYRAAEKSMSHRYSSGMELKATSIKNSDKNKLFRSMNQYIKFGVIIYQNRLLNSIFSDKKTKQRYLDFAFKIGLKKALSLLVDQGKIVASDVENINVYVDEHTTATDGKYELRESLLQEFKYGIHNWNYNLFFPPMFPEMLDVNLTFCNSEKYPLVRAADIIANKMYHSVVSGKSMAHINNLTIKTLP